MSENGRVGLRDPQETLIEVELDDRVFTVAAFTRSQQARLDAAEEALQAATTTDEAAGKIIDVIDVMMSPTNGQKKTAGAILRELWETDKLAISQLSQLLEDLQEKATDRPT